MKKQIRTGGTLPWSGVGTTVVPTLFDLPSGPLSLTGYFNPIKNHSNCKKRFVKEAHLAAAFGQNKTLKLCQNYAVINIAEEAILAIQQGSGGLLRRANHLARGALVAAALEKNRTVSAEHVRAASTEII